MSETDLTTSDLKPHRGLKATPWVHFVLLVVLEISAILGVFLSVYWWRHGRFVETTNDAYLQSDAVTVAPKVQGYVRDVLVRDNQPVAAGQTLVRIDTANYDAALAQEQAAVEARQADILTAERQVAQQQAAIQRARAELSGARSTAAYALSEANRFRTLSGQGVETAERAAQAKNQADQAASVVQANQAALTQTREALATLQAQVGQARAMLGSALAQARAAQLNLGATEIRAFIAGRIGDRSVRVGQFVQPGMRLMSLVPVRDIYLVANFKETQVGDVRVGQRARVRIDALGGKAIEAVVDSFAPGTGAQFALLPPENATGNFTKIVQRVPVRLQLRPSAAVRDRLLPGLSATVSIDTAQHPSGRL